MNQFKLIRILFFFVFLVACAPSQSGIETAIYKKQTATATSTPTETLIPAGTPTLSSLPSLIPSPTPDIHIIEKIESNENVEIWPEVLRGTDYASIVQKSVKSYQDNLYDASAFFQDYTFDGDYLNWGLDNTFIEGNNIMYDGYGVPRIWVDDTFYYNPVTIAQFALNQYGNYIRGDETARSIFLNDINALLSLQDNNGAFRYNYGWNYYLSGETYAAGWVSAMAQGQAISALTRAYMITKDGRYLHAAENSFQFLTMPQGEGGTLTNMADLNPSLYKYIFFEEYFSKPNGYTLNGFMFTLLGIYDLWQLNESLGKDSEMYKKYFNMGIDSLVKLLPYYDVGGFSSYDLGQYTYGTEPHVLAHYHLIHIYLLHALFSVTGDYTLKYYEELWSSYVKSAWVNSGNNPCNTGIWIQHGSVLKQCY